MAVYAALGLSRALLGSILALVVVIFALFSSKRLHNEAARSVIRAPMSFFDTTPMGRIINRFSKDIDSADYLVGDSIRGFLNTLFVIISTFTLICVIFPIFLAALVPILGVYYFFQAYYRRCVCFSRCC